MTQLDQCPSTMKGEKHKPGKADLAAVPRDVSADLTRSAGTVNGQAAWRSVDELADDAGFRDFLEREFPAGASELRLAEEADGADAASGGGATRRDFLRVMGASIALAGAATVPGCRRPNHTIMTYSRVVPEEIIPGKPLYYATSMPRPDGGAEGLLVETHEGRPTKLEGNPLHPVSAGKISSWALSSILGLYDPDRLKFPTYANPTRGRIEATWDDFRTWAGGNLSAFATNGGAGLAFVVDKRQSPAWRAVTARLRARFPNAAWVPYGPGECAASIEGTRLAFGRSMREVPTITKEGTRVVLSLDREFLSREPGELPNQRNFAATRLVLGPSDSMSRLYCVESGFSLTGGQADHRLRLAPSRVAAFAVALAGYLLPKLGAPDAGGLFGALGATMPEGNAARRFMQECADDLLAPENRGKSLILAGESQPPAVHALVAAMNAALGNIGVSVVYHPLSEDEAADSLAGLGRLAAAMRAGEVDTLVCVGTNPVYDAPGDLDFAELFAAVPRTITLSVDRNETEAASTWSLNAAHYLESWGDTEAIDGTVAPVQPMIAPLYEPALSELEFLAMLAEPDPTASVDGFALVGAAWRAAYPDTSASGGFDRTWRRALHDGVVPGTARRPEAPTVDQGAVARAIGAMRLPEAPSADRLEACFVVGNVGDGRYANIPWLQELPEVGTRTVWDNPALLSPATAKALGLEPAGYSDGDPSAIYTKPKYPQARLATITVDGRTVTAPVWILPGMADWTVQLTLGYGRTVAGRVGDGVGVNVYPLRGSAMGGANRAAWGATVARAEGSYMIASTQNHWSMEGRTSIVRAVDLPAFQRHGAEVQVVMDHFYGTRANINFAERLGELGHTPPTKSIYDNPFNRSDADPDPANVDEGNRDYRGNPTPPAYTQRPQWGMTIDQTTCTGCGVCTIACYSENNIPVVGKKEVAKGREMSWIRVDRYFTGDVHDPASMLHQPVACVHCENAPCETVCPVNATVHGPDGLNYMTYNRCIGTRYCANNCPYKVRRFNFFDYGVAKFNGDYLGHDLIDKVGAFIPGQEGITGSGAHNTINPNLIPPRLREKIDEISKMQKNPDVTVRSRGVMEKCSYCIQRINAAKVECKLADIKGPDGRTIVPDGFFTTACAQACPSGAISFGDILDEASEVFNRRSNARSYALLGYLNTRPRTTHMVRVMNPNPKLVDAARRHSWDDPFHHAPAAHGDGHEGGGAGHADDDHGGGVGKDREAPGGDAGHGPASFRYDRRKLIEDRGYAGSLRVLSAPGGAAT